MKVLHVAEVIKGGVSSVMNELLLSQIKNDNIERVCCLIPDSQRDELNIGDSHIYTFKRNGRNLLSFIFFVWMFIRTVIKEKPTIIHLHSTFAGLFGRTVLILLPFYKGHVIYCPHAFSFMMAKSKWKLNLFAIVERFLSKFTDAIICVSNYEKEIAMVNGIPKEKLFTIYNGVSEVEHIDKLPKSDLFNILYVGRFDYQKGFDRLEKIINGLNYSSSNIKFTIIGDYVSESINNNRKNLDNAYFTGWLPKSEIYSYYYNADLLIIPSRWEGLAMVPLEAFSCKLPVMASSCTSFPEIIKDKYNGFLVDIDNTEIVIQLLNEIAADKNIDTLESLASNAYVTYLEKFSSTKMNEDVYDLYRMSESVC